MMPTPAGARRVAWSIAAWVSGGMPLDGLIGVASAGPLVPYYHLVSDADVAHVLPISAYRSVSAFTSEIDFLLRHFRPVDADAMVDWANGGKSLPRRSFLLTFDDGLREMHDVVAPLLRRKGVPAVFFVNSSFLDNQALFYRFKVALLVRRAATVHATALRRVAQVLAARGGSAEEVTDALKRVTYDGRDVLEEVALLLEVDFVDYLCRERPFLTSDQVQGLIADGFVVGAHSVDHCPYQTLPLDEQLRQTTDDMAALQSRFPQPRRLFAFPFGGDGVSPEFFELARRRCGIELFFGTGGWRHVSERRLVNRVWVEGRELMNLRLLRQMLGTTVVRRCMGQVA